MELSGSKVDNGSFNTAQTLGGEFVVRHRDAMKAPIVMCRIFALWFLEFED